MNSIEAAVSFLKNPLVARKPLIVKISFLKEKGMNSDDIVQALMLSNTCNDVSLDVDTTSGLSTAWPTSPYVQFKPASIPEQRHNTHMPPDMHESRSVPSSKKESQWNERRENMPFGEDSGSDSFQTRAEGDMLQKVSSIIGEAIESGISRSMSKLLANGSNIQRQEPVAVSQEPAVNQSHILSLMSSIVQQNAELKTLMGQLVSIVSRNQQAIIHENPVPPPPASLLPEINPSASQLSDTSTPVSGVPSQDVQLQAPAPFPTWPLSELQENDSDSVDVANAPATVRFENDLDSVTPLSNRENNVHWNKRSHEPITLGPWGRVLSLPGWKPAVAGQYSVKRVESEPVTHVGLWAPLGGEFLTGDSKPNSENVAQSSPNLAGKYGVSPSLHGTGLLKRENRNIRFETVSPIRNVKKGKEEHDKDGKNCEGVKSNTKASMASPNQLELVKNPYLFFQKE